MPFTKLASEIWRAYVIAGNPASGANPPNKADLIVWGTEVESLLAISTPATDDGAALGTTSLRWSDLFLAPGAVINFASGDVTITHLTNNLVFAGASVGYGFDALVYPDTNDGAALGNTARQWSDLFLASGGVINWANGDVTITHAADLMAFAGAASGYTFDAVVKPVSNDGAALGTTALMWSDIFLASGAVINFNNGNATLTHSSGKMTWSVKVEVPDDAYDATAWNGSIEVPTKNAVRDKIEALTIGGLSSKVVNATYDLSTASGTQDITGFGFNPTSVSLNYCVNAGSGGRGTGFAAGGNQGGSTVATDGTTSVRSVTGAIFFTNAAVSTYQFGVVSFITDGIRVTWTKVGAPTGTLGITVLAQK